MELTYVLHPHTDGGGYRWAVHLCPPGMLGRDLADGADPWLLRCVNAGHAATEIEADQVGQTVLYAVGNAFALAGLGMPDVHPIRLDHDPFEWRRVVPTIQSDARLMTNEVTE